MKVVNEVLLTADDFQRLLGAGIEGPVTLVGLLKFRDRAEYPDGRETGLTGAEAFGLYRRELLRRAASAGGRLVHSGPVRHLLLGVVEEPWDEVFVMEYPSAETFVDVISPWRSPNTANIAARVWRASCSSRPPPGPRPSSVLSRK